MKHARIIGSGIAATCCAKLFLDKGWTVSASAPARTPAPPLVLSSLTVQLIELIFGNSEHLFRDAHFLNMRVVRWGRGSVDHCVPTFAVTMAGNVLAERLWADLDRRFGENLCASQSESPNNAWSIYTTRTGKITADGEGVSVETVGRRCALCSEVILRDDVDTSQHFIESTSEGWLFLAPLGGGVATLQLVLPRRPSDPSEARSRVLAQSTLIGGLIAEVLPPIAVFDCAPSRLSRLNGAHWLAAGSAACCYDPLCGDGTGYAIRSGILAAAALNACERSNPHTDYLGYYTTRLHAAFGAHLEACHSFYSAAQFANTWQDEIEQTEAAIQHMGRNMIRPASFGCSLRGLELIDDGAPGEPTTSELAISAGQRL